LWVTKFVAVVLQNKISLYLNCYVMDRYLLNRIFESFSDKRILIVGDVMVDAYVWGSVSRISPEAPVPVVSVDRKEYRLGGAANVAKNIKSLGATPIVCSIIGDDDAGKIFRSLLAENGMMTNGIITSNNRRTTVKTRIISSSQQLLRIDEEDVFEAGFNDAEALVNAIKKFIIDGIDAIIFEDYDKGVLTRETIENIVELANKHGIITTVDPKKKNFLDYRNVTLFKPNLKEIKNGLNVDIHPDNKEKFIEVAKTFLVDKNFENLVVTLSEYGIFGLNKDGNYKFYPAEKRSIADVSGAGDTVISVLTLCLTSGCNLQDSIYIANIAGGLVCEKVGVVPIDKSELYDDIIERI
jgi:rfaE bifunctional protein kinase chain/domain